MSTRHSEVAEPQPNRSMQNLNCHPEFISGSIRRGSLPKCHCEERSDEAIQETKFSVGKINTKTELLTFGLPRFARNDKRAAFTLAEVLITLAIIGVVATMTIPTLIANYNDRAIETATSVFNRRLGEALKIMNVNGTLANRGSTANFVEELSKHIKIVKTCDKGSLDDCFAAEITTDTDPIEVSKLQSAKNLQSEKDFGETDTMGVMFADGTSALIAYNKNTPYDPYSSEIVELSGTGKSASLNTTALSILFDVNGLKSPNKIGTDIKGINESIKTGNKVELLEGTYTWANAKTACESKGMKLPEIGSYSGGYCPADAAEDTLCGLYNNREALGLPTSGFFWSASEYGTSSAWRVGISSGFVSDNSKYISYSVVCVGD